jgi:hypothetical protein
VNFSAEASLMVGTSATTALEPKSGETSKEKDTRMNNKDNRKEARKQNIVTSVWNKTSKWYVMGLVWVTLVEVLGA